MKVGLLVRMRREPNAPTGRRPLRGAQESVQGERHTVTPFAFRQDATAFGVFDALDAELPRSRRPLARNRPWPVRSARPGLSSVAARVGPGPLPIAEFPQNDSVHGRTGRPACRRLVTSAREERERR